MENQSKPEHLRWGLARGLVRVSRSGEEPEQRPELKGVSALEKRSSRDQERRVAILNFKMAMLTAGVWCQALGQQL